jgi:hypothetical protein
MGLSHRLALFKPSHALETRLTSLHFGAVTLYSRETRSIGIDWNLYRLASLAT